MLKCIVCDIHLVGQQKKYCSNKCKCKITNFKYQNYIAQQKRGIERKLAAIQQKGGCCQICGYKRNTAALCFHHRISKSFKLDLRHFSNNSEKTIQMELEKCDLLCTNCHAELHNPDLHLDFS